MNALEQAWGLPLFVLGTCFGSFLNVCITRLPAGESVVFPASRCRACKARVPGWANVPLMGYVLLRARCAHCRAPISLRYFLVELFTGVLALALRRRFGLGRPFWAYFPFTGALLAAAVIDFETGIIPDAISVWGTVAGLMLSWCAPALSLHGFPSPLGSLLGALLGGGALWAAACGYRAATGRDGMGGGDVKLLAMIGAFVGWNGVPGVLLVSALTGSLWGAGLMVLRKDVSLATPLPFAPFLCAGALCRVL